MSARLLHRYLGSCVYVHNLKNREEKKINPLKDAFCPSLRSSIFRVEFPTEPERPSEDVEKDTDLC